MSAVAAVRRRQLAEVAAFGREHQLDAFVFGDSVTVILGDVEVEVQTVEELQSLVDRRAERADD